MRRARFFVSEALRAGIELDLPGKAAHHAAVLRLRRGDALTLFDGRGGEYEAELVRIGSDTARVRVVAACAEERESPLAITLAQCLAAGERMDFALQKATELGVARIVPVASERSVVKLAGARAARRLEHWRAIVTAACEQCGRNRLPPVEPLCDFDALMATPVAAGELRLVLDAQSGRPLREFERSQAVTLLCGPEGGLTPQELRRARTAGFAPLSLGPRILRTETAPLAAIAAIQALWGDL